MRHLGLTVLGLTVLALALATSTAHAWGAVCYNVDILADQKDRCPPRGYWPDGGCDQCLPVNHHPFIPLFQIFCGPSFPCRMNPIPCDRCNGTCTVMWGEGPWRWARVFGAQQTAYDVISGCNQWLGQRYCTTAGGGEITGAYCRAEDFGWIPPPHGGYERLGDDLDYQARLAAYTGPPPSQPNDGWLHRIGIFVVLAQGAMSEWDREYWSRAANLCAWYYINRAADPGEMQVALDAMGFPDNLTHSEWEELEDILEATCSARPFADCLEAIEPSTWGGIKHLYREP